MDPLAIATTVLSVIQLVQKGAPIVISGISDAKVFATNLFSALSGRAPTAEEEAAIDAQLALLTAQLEEPLPAAQPGDPDYKP